MMGKVTSLRAYQTVLSLCQGIFSFELMRNYPVIITSLKYLNFHNDKAGLIMIHEIHMMRVQRELD